MPEPIDDSQPGEEQGSPPRHLHAVIDDPTHATPAEVSGYTRHRDAINNMRRAACFRLAELSRPPAEGERPKLTLPTVAPSENERAEAPPAFDDPPAPEPAAPPKIATPPSWLMQREQLGDSATTLGLLLIDYADANIRRHLDLARALLTAKSLAEAIERHDTYMKSSTRIFEEQSAELQALAGHSTEA